MAEKRGMKTKQVCGFIIGDEHYGIDVLDVQEVIKPGNITSIPTAKEHIWGMINLRGQIVTVISLRGLLHYPHDYLEQCMKIIIRYKGDLYALVVDKILDVIDVDLETFDETPKVLTPSLRAFIRGVYKQKNKMIIELDIKQVIENSYC